MSVHTEEDKEVLIQVEQDEEDELDTSTSSSGSDSSSKNTSGSSKNTSGSSKNKSLLTQNTSRSSKEPSATDTSTLSRTDDRSTLSKASDRSFSRLIQEGRSTSDDNPRPGSTRDRSRASTGISRAIQQAEGITTVIGGISSMTFERSPSKKQPGATASPTASNSKGPSTGGKSPSNAMGSPTGNRTLNDRQLVGADNEAADINTGGDGDSESSDANNVPFLVPPLGRGDDEQRFPSVRSNVNVRPTNFEVPDFERMRTVPVAVIMIILCVGQIIVSFILPEMCERAHTHSCSSEAFSILVYAHGFQWAAILVCDQVLKCAHHKSRLAGYIDFYINTKNMRRTPFYLVSLGNAILIIVVIILHDVCDNSEKCVRSFTKLDLLRGLTTLEALAVIAIFGNYIYTVRLFNEAQAPPDCYTEDFVTSSVLVGISGEGFRHLPIRDKHELIEKQSEVIRYLIFHTETLCRKVRTVTLEMEAKERAEAAA